MSFDSKEIIYIKDVDLEKSLNHSRFEIHSMNTPPKNIEKSELPKDIRVVRKKMHDGSIKTMTFIRDILDVSGSKLIETSLDSEI